MKDSESKEFLQGFLKTHQFGKCTRTGSTSMMDHGVKFEFPLFESTVQMSKTNAMAKLCIFPKDQYFDIHPLCVMDLRWHIGLNGKPEFDRPVDEELLEMFNEVFEKAMEALRQQEKVDKIVSDKFQILLLDRIRVLAESRDPCDDLRTLQRNGSLSQGNGGAWTLCEFLEEHYETYGSLSVITFCPYCGTDLELVKDIEKWGDA